MRYMAATDSAEVAVLLCERESLYVSKGASKKIGVPVPKQPFEDYLRGIFGKEGNARIT
jgi:hypothetical protein